MIGVQTNLGKHMENNTGNNVTIVDVKMPFMSMVVFMVKAAIAAIPAVFILVIIGTIISMIMGMLFGGGSTMMSQ